MARIEHDGLDRLGASDTARPQDRLDDFDDIRGRDQIVAAIVENGKTGKEANTVNKKFAPTGLRADSALITLQGHTAVDPGIIRKLIELGNIRETDVIVVVFMQYSPFHRQSAGSEKAK